MKILNEVNDEILGDLMCFSDEKLEPICWGKYVKYKLFFREEIIAVKFNLHFCDVNFNVPYLDEKNVVDTKNMMWNVYQEFLLNGTRAEDILFKEFSEGFFLEEEGLEKEEIEEYRRKYRTKEELFKDIILLEVRIFSSSYHIIISVPWEEGEVAIVDWDIFDKEKRYGVLIAEEESEFVEMNWRQL